MTQKATRETDNDRERSGSGMQIKCKEPTQFLGRQYVMKCVTIALPLLHIVTEAAGKYNYLDYRFKASV